MCESTAFIQRGQREEKLLEDVARVLVRGDTVVLTGILGHSVTVKGEIVDLDLMGHRVVLRERAAKKAAPRKRPAR